MGVCRAALSGGPAQAQAKTIAESANISRGLRKEFGTEEGERRAANK
jgi:hypothetical protein